MPWNDLIPTVVPRNSGNSAEYPEFQNMRTAGTKVGMHNLVVRYPWTKTALTPSFNGLPPHACILAQLEGLKAALESSKNEILAGVKSDLDERRLGSQSYFDKEEIIAKMGDYHNELMKRVEVVGRRSYTAIQAGHAVVDFGQYVPPGYVLEGTDDSVPALSAHPHIVVDPSSGRRFEFFFFLQVKFHVFQTILLFQK